MDSSTDIHLTRSETRPTTPVESGAVDHEAGASTAAPRADSVPNNPNLHSPDIDASFVINGDDIEAHEERSLAHSFRSDQEHSDLQTEGSMTDQHDTYPQSNSDMVVLPESIDGVPRSRCMAGGFTSSTNIDDTEDSVIAYPRKLALLRARTVSAENPSRNEGEANLGHTLDSLWILHPEPEQVQSASLARIPDGEESQEDISYHCEDLLPSLPPSSSPPQLFSSSPCASSQSSAAGVEPSKTAHTAGVGQCMSCHEYAQGDRMESLVKDDSHLESKNVHSNDADEVATSPQTGKHCSQAGPTLCIPDSFELSRRRSADHDESYNPLPSKRPKLDSCPYPPPTPKRATQASQKHQFKKLAAPFRPPSKLSAVMDEPTEIANNKKFESAMGTSLETIHDNEKSTISFQHRTSNTSRCVTQFKSPLINRTLAADSRIIRLTPALQALERKLQLLKRAIKVKDQNEEEVLVRLAEKWIEAGREVAYDVWDATKDSGDFTGKATFTSKSHGWENSNDRRTPWGWDTKSGEESRGADASETSCTMGRQVSDDDVVVVCNTLGTMLRQLGIDTEIFGWDDDKEAFSD